MKILRTCLVALIVTPVLAGDEKVDEGATPRSLPARAPPPIPSPLRPIRMAPSSQS